MTVLGYCEKCHGQKLINEHGWCRACEDARGMGIPEPRLPPGRPEPLPDDKPAHITDKDIWYLPKVPFLARGTTHMASVTISKSFIDLYLTDPDSWLLITRKNSEKI